MRGNILVAWDPVNQKERWRGLAAGFNQGGTLATAGNLVFSSTPTGGTSRLLGYRADNGDLLLDVQTGLSQLGPPMTFMLDGKQYLVVSGSTPAAGGGRGGGGAGPGGGAGRGGGAPGGAPAAPAAPPQPAKMLVFVLDGKAPLPGATPTNQ